jgi:hypothetical protein
MVQLLLELFNNGKLPAENKIITFMRKIITDFNLNNKKSIELAIAIESCKYLIETRNICNKVEQFIMNLLNSENQNLRYMAFRLISKYKILTKMCINLLIKLGIQNNFYLSIMENLIDHSNYKYIHKRREEIIHYSLKCKIDYKSSQQSFLHLLVAISKVADYEFLCKMLYKYPEIYKFIRKDQLIIKDQSKKLFINIFMKDEIDYFPIVYDILPQKSNENLNIASIAFRHLTILSDGEIQEAKLNLLDELADVLCEFGDLEYNRQIVVDFYKKLLKENIDQILINRLKSMILLFNLVLEKKYIFIENNSLITYKFEDELLNITLQESRIKVDIIDLSKDGTEHRKYLINDKIKIL